MSDELNVILLLDLADENQVTEAWIRGRDPALVEAPPAIRLTDFGVKRYGIGTPDNWLPVTAAIERMLRRAREYEGGATCRYWVAGKAGLPAFFYLGYRLSRNARVTLINRDDESGDVDILRLPAPRPPTGTATYFQLAPDPWPPSRSDSRLPVGLLVTSLQKVTTKDIEGQMSLRGDHLAAVLGARSTRRLDRETVGSALVELNEIARQVHHAHTHREALAVFVAGPATLAFLVGRALSQSVFPDISVFQGKQCQLAYPIGYRRTRHSILFLTSNPLETGRLELDEELRAVQLELRSSEHRERFQLEPKPATRAGDLLAHLRDVKPTILHVSGHGCSNGVLLRTESGASQIVAGDDIATALEAARCFVRIVILSACHSDTQAEALLAHADCVIAMSGPIPDEDAKWFAVGFYGGLGARESVETAFKQGCARLALERAGTRSGPRDVELADPAAMAPGTRHELPKLHVRDGVDPGAIVLAEDWR